MKFEKGVLVLLKAKICFTLLAKSVWGAFALRHLASPSFLLVDGKVIYIVVSRSFLRNHLCLCFQFLTVKMSSTEIDILTLFVYTTCPSLAKAGEIKYLNSSRHSCLVLTFLQTYVIAIVQVEQPGIANYCVQKM